METIIAIGGGEIKDQDTLSIDKQILELTGKTNPKILFIPTGSGDAEGYIQTFNDYFGNILNAQTESLRLHSNPSSQEVEDKILGTNAIYVGGGNTQKMLQIWKNTGVDKLLEKVWKSGTILSGLSAGALCWFEYGSSDSQKIENAGNPEFEKHLMLLPALGFVPGLFSPHHVREPHRDDMLPALVKESGVMGYAVDDNAAIQIIDGQLSILRSRPGARVRKIYESNDEMIWETIT